MPPPLVEGGTVAGGVHLTAEDLARIAEGAGLRVAVGADRLREGADRIRAILGDHILWHRVDRNHPKPADIAAWAQGVSRWASEGLVLLAGAERREERNPLRRTSAVNHLHSGWTGADERQLRAKLSFAGRPPFSDPEQDSTRSLYGLIDDLIKRMPFALTVIKDLAEGALRKAQAEPGTRRPDYDRRLLFRRLGAEFEALHHPQRFTKANRYVKDADGRSNQPYGPALDWCRSLFKLCVERVQSTRGDLLPELADLNKWAARSDALAERISEAAAALHPSASEADRSTGEDG